MTAERSAGLDSYFSDEDILAGGKESFYDTYLTKMKLKIVSVETRRSWITIGSILYALYCASGLLWTSVIQREPHRQREIQDFSSGMTSYGETLHAYAYAFVLALTALAFERVYALFKSTIPETKAIFSSFLANLKTDNSTGENRQLLENFSRYLLVHGIVTCWDVCPSVKALFPERNYKSLVELGAITQQECDCLSANQTNQPEIAANWLIGLVRDALANNQLNENQTTKRLLLDIRCLNDNFNGIKRTLPFGGQSLPHLLLLSTKLMVYGFGIFALLGRFDLNRDGLNTDPSLAIKIIITFLPTPKMLKFGYFWLLLQGALVLADPFGNLDMNELLVKQNRYFNRVLNDYFPEDPSDDQVPAGALDSNQQQSTSTSENLINTID